MKAEKLSIAENIGEYIDTYHSNELDVTYTLTLKDIELFIDAVKKYRGANLRMIAADIFLSPTKGIKLRFQRDDEGNISSFFLDSFRSQNFLFYVL